MVDFKITRLNHVVFYVRDAQRSMEFYRDVLGFSVVENPRVGAYFMRANGSDNHHDIGLFSIGEGVPGPTRGRQVGLYHAAWQLEAIEDLARVRERLVEVGSYVGESDHGNSFSVYAQDPDGNEFEVFWMLPREEWSTRGFHTRRLYLEEEIANRAAAAPSR